MSQEKKEFFPPETIVMETLKFFNLTVSKGDVSSELKKHPNYPSLFSICAVLQWFGVPNTALEVKPDELMDVQVPFLAYSKQDELLLIKEVNNDEISYLNHSGKNVKTSIDGFLAHFKGIVVSIERPAVTAYTEKSSFKVRGVLVAISILIFTATLIFKFLNVIFVFNWQIMLLMFAKILGLFLTLILLWQSFNENSSLLDTICGDKNKKGCASLLSSSGESIIKGWSWSEIGFFYFFGTLLLLLVNQSPASQLLLMGINILALPMTIYSIYYQSYVAKQWCRICVSIQVLLWIEFCLFLTTNKHLPTEIIFNDLITALLILVMPIIILTILKPLLETQNLFLKTTDELSRLKYNQFVFNSLLNMDPASYKTPTKECSIVLGDVTAKTIITVVSNPSCKPCQRVHEHIDKWLNVNCNIQVRLLFYEVGENSESTKVSKHLLALDASANRKTIKNAIHDWYSRKFNSYDKLAEAYKINELFDISYKRQLQSEWCTEIGVRYTPFILINNKLMPKNYMLEDLRYLVE